MPEVMATEGMSARGYTPKVMFQKADDFYQSLGFPHLPKRFWEDSIMERPGDGRSLSCHAAAFDFFNGEDFRIRQCAQVRRGTTTGTQEHNVPVSLLPSLTFSIGQTSS